MDDLKLHGGSQTDIDSLIQTMYTITDDIGTRFGIGKCGVLAMCRGKESECEVITIGSGEVIGEIDDDGYKYLDIMERSHKEVSRLYTLNILDQLSSRN